MITNAELAKICHGLAKYEYVVLEIEGTLYFPGTVTDVVGPDPWPTVIEVGNNTHFTPMDLDIALSESVPEGQMQLFIGASHNAGTEAWFELERAYSQPDSRTLVLVAGDVLCTG